jgi:hypothetical protein
MGMAGMGAGFSAQQQQAQGEDLLKRKQAKDQFEEEQQAITQKYIRAEHNATSMSLFTKNLDDENAHDMERQKGMAVQAAAEDYTSRNPNTTLTSKVLSASEARAAMAADKNNPASTTHAFFQLGMKKMMHDGQPVFEKDGVTPRS